MVVSISPFRAFMASLSARGTLALCAAVAVAVLATALLGYNELRDGTARRISDRLDHSTRAAGAVFEASRPLPLTARRSEENHPVAFRIASGDGRQLLTPNANLDRLIEAAADVNQGDVHLFRFHSETGLFERIATSARGPGGEHVRTVHFGAQYPAYEALQRLKPFRGAVPQLDRFRLVEFIPIVDDREQLAGALAVDIGWSDEVWRPAWDLVHRQVLTLLVLLLGVAGLGAGLLLKAFQPLRQLSAYARRLARHEPVGAPPGLGRPDEIGDVSAGLAELVVMRDRLEHLAFTDPLTGLANRARLEIMIGQQLERSHGAPPDAALLLFGVDNFRALNDGFGFSVGDGGLREMAARLQSLAPQGTLIARSGADEFAVLAPHCDSYAQMFDHARKLLAALRRPYAQAQGGVFASVSAGFAMLPASDGTPEAVLRNATLALNRAKRQGRNRIEMFSPCFDEEAQRRAELERDLNRAIDSGELLLHFQPLVRTSDRRLIGVEALVRWDHPQLGLIAPGEFVPIAEESGTIIQLGDWVLDEACRMARHWRTAGFDCGVLSINVSLLQLRQPDFTDGVLQTLRRHGVAPQSLCLEITESVFIDPNIDEVRAALNRLAAAGLRLALDDLGSGYSTLRALQDLPFSSIKIDRSFVHGLDTEPRKRGLIMGLVTLGRGLGIEVVAEGAETAEEVSALADLGCHTVQGYYFGRPVPGVCVPPEAERIAAMRLPLNPSRLRVVDAAPLQRGGKAAK